MQRIILIILAAVVSLPVVMKGRESGVTSAPAAFSVISSGRTMVRVSGDVRHSGIYDICANILTVDVINMALPTGAVKKFEPDQAGAGSVTHGTDINLKIQPDGTGIITVRPLPAGERMVLGIALDINAMSEADFDRLPGVGPFMARRIVEYRQINGGNMKVEDLMAVEGIGEKKYQTLRKYF